MEGNKLYSTTIDYDKKLYFSYFFISLKSNTPTIYPKIYHISHIFLSLVFSFTLFFPFY